MSQKNKESKNFLQRQWLYFRNGHSVYLIFGIQFVQFVVITYGLYVEGSELAHLFPEIWIWALSFVGIYIPAAMVVGRLHFKFQVPSEIETNTKASPYMTKAIENSKETLYSLKASRISYAMQLKGMKIHNEFAEFVHKQYGFDIGKWNDADFKQVMIFHEVTRRLEAGEDITAIDFKDYVDNSDGKA